MSISLDSRQPLIAAMASSGFFLVVFGASAFAGSVTVADYQFGVSDSSIVVASSDGYADNTASAFGFGAGLTPATTADYGDGPRFSLAEIDGTAFSETSTDYMSFSVTQNADQVTLTSLTFDAYNRSGGKTETISLAISDSATSGFGTVEASAVNASKGTVYSTYVLDFGNLLLTAGDTKHFRLYISKSGGGWSDEAAFGFDNVQLLGEVSGAVVVPAPTAAAMGLGAMGLLAVLRRKRAADVAL